MKKIIQAEEYLINHYDEIKKLCEVFNARASIRLNKRSYEKVGFKAMVNIANTMSNKEYEFIKAAFTCRLIDCLSFFLRLCN